MKYKWLSFIILCISSYCYSQPNQMYHLVKGEFINVYDNYIIYKQNEGIASEYANYTIYTLDVNTQKNTQQDVLSTNICPQLKGDTLLYIKGLDIIQQDLKTQRKTIYQTYGQDTPPIAIGYNPKTDNTFVILLDYIYNKIVLKTYDCNKTVFFNQAFNINQTEMEGISPIVYNLDRYLIFQCLSSLFVIDCVDLTYQYISQSCSHYALGKKNIIFYTDVDRNIYGYTYNFKTRKIQEIVNDMSNQIKNCINPILYTAFINGNYQPYYVVCNVPYRWKNNVWNEGNSAVLFENENLEIILPIIQNYGENVFKWALK